MNRFDIALKKPAPKIFLRDKKRALHAIIGVGILGTNRANENQKGMVSMAHIVRETWIENTITNKISWKKNGFILLPIVQIKSKEIERVRKKLHEYIDQMVDQYSKQNINNYLN